MGVLRLIWLAGSFTCRLEKPMGFCYEASSSSVNSTHASARPKHFSEITGLRACLRSRSLISTYGHLWDELLRSPSRYLPTHGLVQAPRAAVRACNSSPSQHYLLLRLPLRAAVKMAAFVVQLAQDHVVLEEKLVSHAKSAEGNKNMEVGLGSCSRSE